MFHNLFKPQGKIKVEDAKRLDWHNWSVERHTKDILEKVYSRMQFYNPYTFSVEFAYSSGIVLGFEGVPFFSLISFNVHTDEPLPTRKRIELPTARWSKVSTLPPVFAFWLARDSIHHWIYPLYKETQLFEPKLYHINTVPVPYLRAPDNRKPKVYTWGQR